MTLLSRTLLFFPFMHSFLIFISFYLLFTEKNFYYTILVLLTTYLFPVLIFRIHSLFYRNERSLSKFSKNEYNPWWGGHQIQGLFIAYPELETFLRLVPGLYSQWLRLWGAKIGKNVYWTPATEILDRNLIEVGDNVVFGHLVKTASHIVTPRKDKIYLFTKKIIIEDNCFIGAGVVIGPGTHIPKGEIVKAGTDYFNNTVYEREQTRSFTQGLDV